MNGSPGEFGIPSLLTVAFIVLKLVHEIDWSWWWVLAPIWIGVLLAILYIVSVLVFVWWHDRSRI